MKPSTPVEELEISVRSSMLLQEMGIEKLSGVAGLSSEQILAHPHGTKRVVAELREVLSEVKMKLADDR